jgi:hypothetical protein
MTDRPHRLGDDQDEQVMIPDDEDDCTMWTVGAFCNPRLDPYEVFERTDVMAGPSHQADNVSLMITKLGLGDGQYRSFATPAEARRYMLDSMMERFAYGVTRADRVGHMVNVYRDGQTLTFLDFQVPPHGGIPVQPPTQGGWRYFIWPINDAN